MPDSSSGIPNDVTDVRDALRLLGIRWRTDEHLTQLHTLAERSLFAARQMIGALVLADTPRAVPQDTFELWLQHLLQTAVEVQLFPDRVPADAASWDSLAAIWDEYIAHTREFHLSGVQRITEGDPWSIRGAVKAAWNIEFAAVGSPAEIGPIAADSAHRAALRCTPELWLAFRQYTDQVIARPADRPRLWDTFASHWCSEAVRDQCERVRARLAAELASMRDRLNAKTKAPTATSIAVAGAQASVGNIIVQNQIMIPVPSGGGDGAAGVAAAPPVAEAGGDAPATPAAATESPMPRTEDDTDGAGGPEPDPHDTRRAVWMGKSIYLGNDTQVSRLFWLLARPLGGARTLGQVQRAIDGMETDRGCAPEELEKAGQRVRKVISKLRAALREAGLDDHVLIVRDGTQAEPEYSMVWRFAR